ncbi:MAG: tellurium resistance TerZ family protein, partial [Muribaculaceae bacterium]|nr:tellurium resistance TerZ family protein [Muribaculaceae bacterium]
PKFTNFCVGCNWGAIVSGGFLGLGRKVQDVDLDLSCVMVDEAGNLVDHIYSPLYRTDFLGRYGMPPGKINSREHALRHSGDDLKGDLNGDDGLDNEIITVDLARIGSDVQQIFFFLNNVGKEDFSQIPYASIRMYEGTPSRVKEVFATYNVGSSPQYQGKKALIMGKLYRRNGEWKFSAIGDAYPDANLCETIRRIVNNYAK